ncbi:hypothetical protein HUU05_10700 [candidate division KSB1 bacterium]|nr:hypothetical protein [candidate division KSB1 bacterium]
MKEEEILSGLEKILESLGIELRYEKGDFSGGYCVLKEKPMMIVQSTLSEAQKIKALARELAQMDLQNVFIVPALREVIDEVAGTNAVQN